MVGLGTSYATRAGRSYATGSGRSPSRGISRYSGRDSSISYNLALVNRLRSKYRSNIPKGFSFNFLNSRDPHAVYRNTELLYNAVVSGWHERNGAKQRDEKHKPVYYRSTRTPLGDLVVRDVYSDNYLRIMRRPNGNLDFAGTPFMIEQLGGRGNIAGMIPLLYDGDYFRDRSNKN